MNNPLLGLTVALTLTMAQPCVAQSSLEQIADSITREGRKLYIPELTSWNGTAVFVKKFSDVNKVGGYFSYVDGDSSKCIFLSKGDTPQVIGSVAFDDPQNIKGARVYLTPRALTEQEHQLYLLRQKALENIGSDTFYTFLPHTELNLIPVIEGNERKVIIRTSPKESGIMIFGNDYLLTFDENDQLVSRRRLHQDVFVAGYGTAQVKGKDTRTGTHTHSAATGEYITPTDVCTLLLYGNLVGCETYYVLSDGYVSIWESRWNKLGIMTKETYDKLYQKVKRAGAIGVLKGNER